MDVDSLLDVAWPFESLSPSGEDDSCNRFECRIQGRGFGVQGAESNRVERSGFRVHGEGCRL